MKKHYRITHRGWRPLLALALLGLYVLTVPSAGAIPLPQKTFFKNGVLWANALADPQCGTGQSPGTALASGENPKVAFMYFVDKGLTPEQSAGIVGNLMVESTPKIDPGAEEEGNTGEGRGIAQWGVNDRWAIFVNEFAPTSTREVPEGQDPIYNLGVQLDFLWWELQNTQKASYDALVATATPEDAAYQFMLKFERPLKQDRNDPSNQLRESNALEVFNTFSGTVGAGIGGVVTVSNTCGVAQATDCLSATGQTATGRLAIVCEAQRFDPYGYLWGGGHSTSPQAWMDEFNANGGFNGSFRNILDCSGLIRIAIYNAFGVDVGDFVTQDPGAAQHLERISISETEPGDLVFTEKHSEIVLTPGATETFGATSRYIDEAETQEKPQADQIKASKDKVWTSAWRYTGPLSRAEGV